jgi:hypothetical protein
VAGIGEAILAYLRIYRSERPSRNVLENLRAEPGGKYRNGEKK